MEMDPKKLFPGKPRLPGTEPKFGFDTCVAFCNPTLNFYRSCPPTCIRFCPTFCQFLPPPPPSPSIHTGSNEHHHNLHHTLVTPVFISMFVLLAAAFVIAMSYLIYSFFSSSLSDPSQSRRQRSNRITEFDQSIDVLNFHPAWYIATVGLQRSMIDSIGMCEYKKGDGLVQGTACSVCLAEFQDGEALRLLPKCCHGFHVPCIDMWLISHTTCPVCRALVLQANNSFQPREAQVVEIVDEPSSSGGELERETREEGEEGEEWRQMRRAASMDDSLCVELGEKINSSSSGFNSLGVRSHSCTSKLLSSGRNGFG